MKEISLHIMDIVQNSITANAALIELFLNIQRCKNRLSIIIKGDKPVFSVLPAVINF